MNKLLLLFLFPVIIMATARLRIPNADPKLALNDVVVKSAKQYFLKPVLADVQGCCKVGNKYAKS